MSIATVYRCVGIIGGAISQLPLHHFRLEPDGTRKKQPKTPLWWLLNESPNDDMSAAAFWEFMIEGLLFHGDGFAEIVRPHPGSNVAIGFRVLHPLRVQPFRRADDGQLLYVVNPDYRFDPQQSTPRFLDPADILHITGPGFNGLRSVSPITYAARQAIGTSMAAEEFSGRFFSTGARPDIVLEAPGKVDADQVALLRSTWTSRYGGVEGASAGPVVLSNGLKMSQLSLSAEDSQLIATRQFQIEEIARSCAAGLRKNGQCRRPGSCASRSVERLPG
jgi:HK97 family phage portal protein